MTKYVSVPTEIEAVQFTGDNYLEIAEFTSHLFELKDDVEDDIVAEVWDELQGTWVGVKLNDWIIRGTKGEYYPCNDGVFQEKYRQLPEGSTPFVGATPIPVREDKPQTVMELPIHLPGNNRNWETVAGVATIDDKGDIHIRLKDAESAEALVDMARNRVLLQLAFDYRQSSDKLEKINKRFQMEYHDEQTLNKVHKAIRLALHEAGYPRMTDDEASNVIRALQNAGILFRERK